MTTASTEALGGLHEALATLFIDKIKTEGKGLAAADLSVIRQFLRDNNIQATGPRAAITALGEAAGTLPFNGTEEDPEDLSSAPLRIVK